MTPAGGIHGVGCGASVWSAGRGLCRYELGGLRMLVIGPLHLKADADKDAEACVAAATTTTSGDFWAGNASNIMHIHD